jgi:quercetin dioxygenase-like cupin family protein
MIRLVSAWFIVLACALPRPADAQTTETPVPIVKAPYHRPVFTNQYLTLLDIYIPPGRNSGYHTHSQDSVSVNIVVGQQTNQDFGSETITPPAGGGERGRATFFPYVKEGPRTHKATNIGPTPFHNVSFLLTSPTPYKTTPSTRAVHGFTQVMDNERVRGWRVQLEPGQSTGQMTQSAPGLRIVVVGGEIAELVPGVADRAWWLSQGQYFWQEPGTTRSIKNIGTTPVDFVEFELK